MGTLKRFTKWKKIITAITLAAVGIFIYIWASSTHINEQYYRVLAFKTESYNYDIVLDWRRAPVTVVKFNDTKHDDSSVLSVKISRALLFLNGGYAVKVEESVYTGKFEKTSLYFNPFTKKYIAGPILY